MQKALLCKLILITGMKTMGSSVTETTVYRYLEENREIKLFSPKNAMMSVLTSIP